MSLIGSEKSVWLVGKLGNEEEQNFKDLLDVEFLVTLILVCTGILFRKCGERIKANCVVMNLYGLSLFFSYPLCISEKIYLDIFSPKNLIIYICTKYGPQI